MILKNRIGIEDFIKKMKSVHLQTIVDKRKKRIMKIMFLLGAHTKLIIYSK